MIDVGSHQSIIKLLDDARSFKLIEETNPVKSCKYRFQRGLSNVTKKNTPGFFPIQFLEGVSITCSPSFRSWDSTLMHCVPQVFVPQLQVQRRLHHEATHQQLQRHDPLPRYRKATLNVVVSSCVFPHISSVVCLDIYMLNNISYRYVDMYSLCVYIRYMFICLNITV